jgi:hypothetical protein
MSLTRMAHKTLLVLFSVLAAHIQSATAGLMVFDSKSAFLATAPIETTEDFESFASPTLFPTPQVTFDGVTFSATPSPSPWVVDNSVGLLRTNTLGTLGIVRHEISFGEGRDVTAFGFTFLGGGTTNGVPARYDISVLEIDGIATTVPLTLFPGTYYFGFLSEKGIDDLSIAPVPSAGGEFFWRYDDFSSSSISVVPEPTSLSLLSIGAVLLFHFFSVQKLRRMASALPFC